jgi:hypothetical protein
MQRSEQNRCRAPSFARSAFAARPQARQAAVWGLVCERTAAAWARAAADRVSIKLVMVLVIDPILRA